MDSRGMIIWAVFITVCAVIILLSRRMKKEISEDGIETTATVSRITETGTEDIDYTYYVVYRTQDGEEVEGILQNPREDLKEGQRVRIKYHPKYTKNARLIG